MTIARHIVSRLHRLGPAVVFAWAIAWSTGSLAAKPEMRGICVQSRQISSRAEADKWVAKIEAAHLNTVIVEVFYKGQVHFLSDLCPMAKGVEPGHDPLGYLIQECHRRGIEVHVWFVSGSAPPSSSAFIRKHPDWLVDGNSTCPWYDLGKPEVRRFQSDLMIEALQKYDVDGLLFDYIRYEDVTLCYCKHCQDEFASRYDCKPFVRPTTYPVLGMVSSRAVGGPTTAKVLAEFSDHTPAIAVNELERGKALLVNWDVLGSSSQAVNDTILRTLREWKASSGEVAVMDTAPNRVRYGREHTMALTCNLFRTLGYQAKVTPEERLASLPAGAVVVLPGVYLIPDEVAANLESFVRRGGLVVILDGPLAAIRNASVQRVLGMSRAVGYFRRLEVVQPLGRSDLLVTSDVKYDLEQERLRMQKWAEYRKAGVTELVRDVYGRAKQLKPKVQVSASVFTPLASADRVCQDWPRWLREGIVDFIAPMCYRMKNEQVAKELKEWQTIDPQLERIIPLLCLYQQVDGKAISRSPELVLSQHQLSLDHGSHGDIYFDLNYLDQSITEALVGKYYPTNVPAYHPPLRAVGTK